MKTYNEIADSVLERRDTFITQQKARRKRLIQASTAVGCFILVTSIGFSFSKSDWFKEPAVEPLLTTLNSETEITNGINTTAGTDNITTDNKLHGDITTSPTTQPTSQYSDEGSNISDGTIGNLWMIPALPFDRSIKLTGEAITDEEANAYFVENAGSIIGGLSSSSISEDNIIISDRGYSHVYYDGTEGKSFEIRQNYRDYLVYNGEKLIATITLFKENGEIYNTPMFGAKWFEGYGKYLNDHKGEKLVFVYAKSYEIIIAPDNTYYTPMGADDNSIGLDITSKYLEGLENPYDVFYHELATYIP